MSLFLKPDKLSKYNLRPNNILLRLSYIETFSLPESRNHEFLDRGRNVAGKIWYSFIIPE
jgi:hypothetical protein